MITTNRHTHKEHGTVAVEFAICLPLMAVLLVNIFAFYDYITVRRVVHEFAAREAYTRQGLHTPASLRGRCEALAAAVMVSDSPSFWGGSAYNVDYQIFGGSRVVEGKTTATDLEADEINKISLCKDFTGTNCISESHGLMYRRWKPCEIFVSAQFRPMTFGRRGDAIFLADFYDTSEESWVIILPEITTVGAAMLEMRYQGTTETKTTLTQFSHAVP